MTVTRNLLLGVIAFAAAMGDARAQHPGAPGRFDHWVLSLSWSPSYCASRAGARDRQQCGRQRRFAFVVHGAWPQYRHGWPAFCIRPAPYLAERHLARMRDIMPARRLILHQWRKHGTCSGLSQATYFSLTRQLFNRIKIPARYLAPRRPITIAPDRLKADFVKTNNWLTTQMFTLHCGNRQDRARLREMRFCFSRAHEPIACPARPIRACRAARLVLPPVR